MSKKRLIVLTGAGISAESGIQTFRGSDGLWEGHDIMEVASPEGWAANPELVLNFYNLRRKQLETVEPNAAHYGLKELEEYFDVTVITQNVDNLHERAGSSRIAHLHGELTKVRCTCTTQHGAGGDIAYQNVKMGHICEKGSQMRPDIVWFGEDVPMMRQASLVCELADLMVIIGTSLEVYPAAALMYFVPPYTPLFLVDPNIPPISDYKGPIKTYAEKATTGVAKLKKDLIKEYT